MADLPPTRLLYTVPEAAALLSVSRDILYQLISAGRIEALHIGRSVRIRPAALEAYVGLLVAEQTAAPGPDWVRDLVSRGRAR